MVIPPWLIYTAAMIGGGALGRAPLATGFTITRKPYQGIANTGYMSPGELAISETWGG
jgi:hypothetical protein